MGCNASVEDGEENPQNSALGKSEKGELSLQRICFYQLQYYKQISSDISQLTS